MDFPMQLYRDENHEDAWGGMEASSCFAIFDNVRHLSPLTSLVRFVASDKFYIICLISVGCHLELHVTITFY